MIQDIREFQIKEEKANYGVDQEWWYRTLALEFEVEV